MNTTTTSNQISGEQPPGENAQGAKSQSQGNLENFKVAVRLRPFTERERQRQSRRIVDIEHNTVALYNPKWPDEATKRFTFDYSYWSHDGFRRDSSGVHVPDPTQANCDKYVDQQQVFEDLGRFLLENALEGYNSALLAYGQTGSGKSYTVSGYGKNEGILPRFARELFAELGRRLPAADRPEEGPKSGRATCRFEVYFSMVEIYNEVVRDLLAKQTPDQKGPANASSVVRRGLRVREHPKRGFFVEALSSYQCASKEEIESLIEEGQLNKSIAATSMNETSSRGHTIYEFHIRQFRPREKPAESSSRTSPATPTPTPASEPPTKSRPPPGVALPVETMTSSVVQLVDLAGSERMAVQTSNGGGGGGGNLDSSLLRPLSRSGSPMLAGGQSARSARSSTTATGGSGSQAPGVGAGARRPHNQPPPSSASSSSSAAAQPNAGFRRQANSSAALLGPNMSSLHQQRFKESVSINQSLSALGNCIQVLSQFSLQQQPTEGSATKPPKIPYRDSVLTKLLNRCCLSGNSKVVLIATLSPADTNYDDTLSTLRFADRAKQIRTHAVINRSVEGVAGSDMGVSALQRENERLKQILDGRVTRSDDSSQTSNFDESENVQDNFQGPKAASVVSASASASPQPQPQPQAGGSPGRKSRRDRATTVTRARATGNKSPAGKQQAATGGATPRRQHKSNDPPSSRSRSTLATSSTGSGAQSPTPPGARLPASGVGPADPMEQLVSPAERKMRQKRRGAGRPGPASISNEDQDDYEQNVGSGVRKSRSLGQSLAGAQEAGASALHLGSQLLDEIDLSELANIIDDENLLSPDSDDSFNQSVARAKQDENMSKQEKATILNKLLSNSNVANRLIKKQIEGSINQVKLDRPKKAGATSKQHLRPVKRAELAGGAGAGGSARRRANPYLSNLNPDEQLSSVITYMIEPGETIVGKDDSCDLLIYGPGLRGRHAKITRKASQGNARPSECFIEPIFAQGPEPDSEQLASGSKASQARRVALLVNGEPVLASCRLSHGDRLLFGSTGYFVFLDEAAAGPTPIEPVTYDMAHAEVMRKMMSESENEAMIREIRDYTHRPGTGRRERARDHDEGGEPAGGKSGASSLGDPQPEDAAGRNPSQEQEARQLAKIREEEGEHSASGRAPPPDETDELYRGRLMADTYEFAMPIAEANAIANEMSIRVTYGLKILAGEEQLEPLMRADEEPAMEGEEEAEEAEEAGQAEGEAGQAGERPPPPPPTTKSNQVIISSEQPIKPETLDLPPELYVHVRLDELELDFYWTKEKFQERRVKMLELYGAWDVGGKSGLVEYLIEQSKYQGYYMIDPFVDDVRSSWVLVGHAQVSLRPLSHAAPLSGRFDVLDVNDETVGSLVMEAVPCEDELAPESGGPEWPYRARKTQDVLREARELLGRKFVFLLRIVSCSHLAARSRFARLFCQYTLNRDQPTIRTKLISSEIRADESGAGNTENELLFEHRHFVVVERVTQDILDFLQHGFLTLQLVGQYASDSAASGKSNQQATNAGPSSAGSTTSRGASRPTLVSAIISSINKYRYRMEQQSAALQNLQFQQNGEYANSLGTYSAASTTYRLNSNSGPSSVTSASNLFDGQPDDDDAVGMGLNGAPNQDNIIDMILTKRKLDRAENQLHYIKRTINIAEHHNKKHIPVHTVKKLLNSYGQELEGGDLEDMAAEVTAETKTIDSKHSNCSIQ